MAPWGYLLLLLYYYYYYYYLLTLYQFLPSLMYGYSYFVPKKKITMRENDEKIRLGDCRIWSTLRQDTAPAFG